MAKRKRKRTKKQKVTISIELYAILLVIISIFGIGRLGPAGRMIASFSLFLTGSIYMVFLFVLFIIGIYAFVKREWPEFFTTKMFGIYLFVIGLLTFMHWDFISLNNNNTNLVFRETIDQLVAGFNSLMATGNLGESIAVGGGLIGGAFALLFAKLFSYVGLKIITIVLILGGICMFTGFSIIDFMKNRIEIAK